MTKKRTQKWDKLESREAVKPTSQTENKSKPEILEHYWNYDSMRLTPISQGTLERLIENGRNWARTEEYGLKLSQFLDNNGIPVTTWNRWRKQYPIIEEGTRAILTILGNKREVGMLTRKLDPASTMFMMPHYDDDYTKIIEWKSNLKQKEGGSGNQQFIILEKAENSPLVPERKKEENV